MIKAINEILEIISESIMGSVPRTKIFKKIIKSLKKRGVDVEELKCKDIAWSTALKEVREGIEEITKDD